MANFKFKMTVNRRTKEAGRVRETEVPVSAVLAVDAEAIARQLAQRAFKSKSRKATAMHGAVVCRVTEWA